MAGPSSLEQSPPSSAATDFDTFLPTVPTRVTNNLAQHLDCLESAGELEPPFTETFRYVLLNEEAHRTRPMLVYITALACGLEPRSVDHYAMAMEVDHAMSVVADDLPAQDNSDKRRHQPSLHVEFDTATAENTATLMAVRADRLVQRAERGHGLHGELSDYVAKGLARMAVGQWMDLRLRGKSKDDVTPMELDHIAARKTATAIELCIAGTAMLAGQPPDVIGELKNYSMGLGIAFQIQDDLMDGLDGPNGSGKAVDLDRKNGRPNYPLVLGAAGAQRRFEYYSARAAMAAEHLSPAVNVSGFEKLISHIARPDAPDPGGAARA